MSSRIVHTLIALAALAALAYWMDARTVQEELAFFRSALADAGIEAPADAEGLRLAYAKAVAHRAPLFFTGAAPEDLDAGAGALVQLSRRLAERQDTAQDAAAISALYPVPLISALARVEEGRRSFLSSGTRKDLTAYETAQEDAVAAYRASLRKFKAAFAKYVPADIRNYATPSSVIGRADTQRASSALERALALQEQQAKERAACARGEYRRCHPADIRLPELPEHAARTLSAEERALSGEIRGTLMKIPYVFDSAFTDAILLSDSKCVAKDQDGAPLFMLRDVRTYEGTHRLTPVYVGNWYFLRVAPGSNLATLPYLESFAKKHIELVPLHPLIYYECQDSVADQGRIFTVRDIALRARHDPFSRYASTGHDALRELERKLGDAYVRETDALAYASLAARSSLPEDEHQAAVDLAMRARNGTGGFYPALLDLIEAEETNLRVAETGVTVDFSPLNLFFTRNALFLFYHNLRSDGSLRFAENTFPEERQPYARYSSLPADTRMKTLWESLSRYHASYEF